MLRPFAILALALPLAAGCLKTAGPGKEAKPEALPSSHAAGQPVLLPSSASAPPVAAASEPSAQPGLSGAVSAPVMLPSTGTGDLATPQAAPPPAVETAAIRVEPPGAGRIVRVSEKMGYVLFEATGRFSAGQTVVAFRDGQPVAKLIIAAPRNRPYLSADIADGQPRVGDAVR